jgi:O-antigen/teichoic acid export membrane protein
MIGRSVAGVIQGGGDPTAHPNGPSAEQSARKQIRGSGLLLVGKLLSLGAKLLAQVLVVRYLSAADYGAWAYALAAVALLGGFAHLSLDRTVSRFASIYHERGQIDHFFGTVALVLGTVVLTGTAFVVTLYLWPEIFARLTGGDPTTLALLFVMIFLVPLEAIDTLLISIFASFSQSRAIFVRRYVVTPAVQVGVVLLLIALHADVKFLAVGYLSGAILGVLLSIRLFIQVLRQHGLLARFALRRLTVPARELFSFSVPLMTSDWLNVLTHSSGALVLGYFYNTSAVAFFRVVLPVATLNQVVIQSFHMLYVPSASRLFARGDSGGVNDLYWRTSLWIAVLTFPLFAVTFATATPLSTLLFGERYARSGLILAIMAIGQYVQSSFGFNGSTLKVLGRVKFLVWSNLAAAIVNIGLTLALVRPFGAVGAAIAMSATMVLHNILKQVGLRAAGVRLFDPRYYAPFRTVVTAAICLIVARAAGIANFAVLAAAAILTSAIVLSSTKGALQLGSVFPEIRRVPLLRLLRV